jgi:hypothetical protein
MGRSSSLKSEENHEKNLINYVTQIAQKISAALDYNE